MPTVSGFLLLRSMAVKPIKRAGSDGGSATTIDVGAAAAAAAVEVGGRRRRRLLSLNCKLGFGVGPSTSRRLWAARS